MNIKSLIFGACEIKIIRYGCIGGFSTLIHIVVAFIYLHFIADSIVFSNIIGFMTAFLFSYMVQSTYVFDHKLSINKAKRYFIVQLGALALSIILAKYIPFNNYIRVILVALILPVMTFFIHKLWTFSTPKGENDESK